MCLQASCATPLPSTCPVAWRYLMRHVSLHPSSFALPQWLRPRSNGHKRMPRQNRLRPSPRSRQKICRRAIGEEGDGSFDHLVGGGKERRWHVEPQRLSGLEIDHCLVFGRQLHRQVSGLLALENTVNVPSCPPILVEEIRTIGRQAASGDEVALVVDCGKLVPGSKCDNQIANRCRVRARGHDQASVGGACECRDGALDLGPFAHAG